MPFNLLSASDPNLLGRELMSHNLSSSATHWYEDLLSQARDSACCLHKFCSGCVSAPVAPDIAVCGTPCHPYSRQRAGRFEHASVEHHREFDVAMADFMEWIRRMSPKCQIFEQVDGFMSPFHKHASETPFDRHQGFKLISWWFARKDSQLFALTRFRKLVK